jgi:hypothetical protein
MEHLAPLLMQEHRVGACNGASGAPLDAGAPKLHGGRFGSLEVCTLFPTSYSEAVDCHCYDSLVLTTSWGRLYLNDEVLHVPLVATDVLEEHITSIIVS